MTIFLSQRPNLDPKPWRSVASGFRYRQEPDDGFGPYVFDPRPKYDTPVNPILASLRKRLQYQRDVGKSSTAPRIATTMLRTLETFQRHGVMTTTPAEMDHARKVLQRLANLTTKED